VLRLGRRSPLELQDRAQWLHASCARILRRLKIETASRGQRPAQGLICSNHLSYLDILVYAAVLPCVFVSKREVARWPAIGWFARAGGTIFVDRQSRTGTGEVTRQIASVLEQGVPVLLFPEGTSTDGSVVQRFHPSLLEPAVQLNAEMTAAAIGYRALDAPERDMCWYGEAAFTPHLIRTMARGSIRAEVEFYPGPAVHRERKAAAIELREQVQALRMRMAREVAQQDA